MIFESTQKRSDATKTLSLSQMQKPDHRPFARNTVNSTQSVIKLRAFSSVGPRYDVSSTRAVRSTP